MSWVRWSVAWPLLLVGCGERATGEATEDVLGDRGDCDAYLECVEVAAPQDLPLLSMRYGEFGSCWDQEGEEVGACLYACAVGLADLEAIYGPGCRPVEPDCSNAQLEEVMIPDCQHNIWRFWSRIDGRTRGALLDIAHTGTGASEQHPMPVVDQVEGTCLEELGLDLAVASSPSEQEAGVSTAFACTEANAEALTWMIRIWSQDADMDCVVVGADPDHFAEHDCNWIVPL